MKKYAVILFNLGGPDSLEAVQHFLFNLFSDRDIFKIPIGQKLFAKLMSSFRAPHVRARYQKIGGKSPINRWTEVQRSMLKQELQKVIPGVKVYTAMRYWKPAITGVAQKISHENYDRIVLLPLYPQYSTTTTGSSFNEWNRAYKGESGRLTYIREYCRHPDYIRAINERIDQAILEFPASVHSDIQIVFSAHGIPESIVRKGDPYHDQTQATVRQAMQNRNFSHEYHLCFQSKVGPAKWLEPATEKMIENLAAVGKKHLLVVPVSFVSDHIETLYELEIEYREVADTLGIENYRVMKGLNDSETFVAALKDLALQAIEKKASHADD